MTVSVYSERLSLRHPGCVHSKTSRARRKCAKWREDTGAFCAGGSGDEAKLSVASNNLRLTGGPRAHGGSLAG